MRIRMLAAVPVLIWAAACARNTPVDSETLKLGRQVFATQSCAGCHGEDRSGTEMAPPLTSVHLHWSADRLQTYLQHPEAVTGSEPRLKDLAGRWELEMPGVEGTSPEEVRALALFLLHSRG